MAKTLLNGVNEVLKKVKIVSSNNELTSLTSSGKQTFIDTAVQAWNEAVTYIFSKSPNLVPYQAAEDQITLVASQRTYGLPDDLIEITWPLQNETDGVYITEYPGGYEELRHGQCMPSQFNGTPFSGAIDPTAKQLYLDSLPTSDDAGDIYKFLYWRDTVLENANDIFPFDDAVFRAMVPVVSEIWRLLHQNKSYPNLAKMDFGQALKMIKQQPARTAYVSRRGVAGYSPIGFDPLEP